MCSDTLSTEMHAVVVTVSDACSKGQREDTSGKLLVEFLEKIGATVVETVIVADDFEPLVQTLKGFAERRDVNLIITTGGTGLSPRDNTPEATRRLIERDVPGIAEAIRAESLKHTPMGMLSRGVCGVSRGTLIINLPGSPKAVRESFAVIEKVLSHAVDLLAGRTAHTSETTK